MNKKDLIRIVADELHATQAQAEGYVNSFIEGIKKGIKKEERVQLVGFGSFHLRKRAARRGRNPQTGEVMQIKATKTVTFKPGKTLKHEI
jgi:nucleoid DNA-binding protein